MTSTAIWICLWVYLGCAGWILSALGQLNAAGYGVALLPGVIWWIVRGSKRRGFKFRPRKYVRRFRRPFPAAFLALAVLVVLGGLLYAPNNWDGLAYRIPRVLHWLAADQWHWIHTIFPRVNVRGCGVEWVSAPVLTLFKTDRPLFLINVVSFLLLPGLVFSVFTRLGIRRRVAWHWMWIVPSGYCYVLQAGGIGNDLVGAPFALAAVDFALRARVSRAPRDFFLSILAAAVLSGIKFSNLPLLLPWALAILPSLKLIRVRPAQFGAICLIALAVSAVPTAIFNTRYAGEWSAKTLETFSKGGNPVLRGAANIVLAAVQNLAPPVFPMAGRWNRAMDSMPPALAARLAELLPDTHAAKFLLGELQTEEASGLGFGVCVLAVVSALAAWWGSRRTGGQGRAGLNWWGYVISGGGLISIVALMVEAQVAPVGRILAPYYALALPLLLLGQGHARVVRRTWWRVLAAAVFAVAAGLVIVSPSRPLFPAQSILSAMHARNAESSLLQRAQDVYRVYRVRADGFAPVRAVLPPDLKVLGMVTFDDLETSLWRPFGSRRILHIRPEDTLVDLQRRDIHYVLLNEHALKIWFNCTVEEWLGRMNGQVVAEVPLNLRASGGTLTWYLIRLALPSDANAGEHAAVYDAGANSGTFWTAGVLRRF